MGFDTIDLVGVAPSGRDSMLLLTPGLRRPPGASPRVMHGTALQAENRILVAGGC